MSRLAVKSNSRIKVFFDYDYELKEDIKCNLFGAQYVPENKCWICSTCLSNFEKLISLNFSLDKDLEEMYYKLKNLNNINTVECNIDIKTPENLSLMPFQKDGVKFLERRNGNALVADEMGLGKTITALTYISLHPEYKPVIIIVPASLKYNWKKEAEKWVLNNRKIDVLNGKKLSKLDKNSDIIILNYDIANAWANEIKKIKPKAIILDEVHMIKNAKSIRSKAVKSICLHIPHKLPLSGTPTINKPMELFDAIDMVEPYLFASYFEFGVKYCNGHHNGYGWDFSGASNLEELYEVLKGLMLRRKKVDVLKDLPDKRYSYIPLELNNSKEYYRAESEFVTSLKNPDKAGIDVCSAEKLFQLAVNGALPDSIDWIKQFLETGEEKLVVFATHKMVIDKLMSEFGKIAVKIDGSISTGQIRQDIVEKFQTDPNIRLFIGNIKAAGVGLTLTAASNVAFLELPWTPAELNQAIDRVHRISQKNAVNVWFLLADNTIEMRLAQILDRKQTVFTKTLDGEDINDENTLSALMNSYR